MSRPLVLAILAFAAGAAVVPSAGAWDGHDRRHDRRQAVVAGAIRREVASDRASERYRECMRDSRYDQDCARQRYEDEQEARRKGWRTAVVVDAIN